MTQSPKYQILPVSTPLKKGWVVCDETGESLSEVFSYYLDARAWSDDEYANWCERRRKENHEHEQ